MQPNGHLATLQPLRSNHGKSRGGGHDSSSGWAISYADLLMVLLCLFIGLSVASDDTENGDDLLKEISVSFKGSDVSQKGAGIGLGSAANSTGPSEVIMVTGSDGKPKLVPNPEAKTIESRIYESISSSLEQIGIQSELMQERNEILLKFEYNLFNKGEIHLDDEAKAKIRVVLDSLEPYKGKVMLSVVGHTDKSPVKTKKSKTIQENIDLAVLRASYATKWIRDTGFPAEDLRIEVSEPQADDRRSLSLHVMVKHLKSGGGNK